MALRQIGYSFHRVPVMRHLREQRLQLTHRRHPHLPDRRLKSAKRPAAGFSGQIRVAFAVMSLLTDYPAVLRFFQDGNPLSRPSVRPSSQSLPRKRGHKLFAHPAGQNAAMPTAPPWQAMPCRAWPSSFRTAFGNPVRRRLRAGWFRVRQS